MYIELHCHSAFSFLDGASLPEQLALTASQLGYPALALTDHNGLYGSMAFAQESKQLGLQAITGAELTLLDGSHVTLLVETLEGYANLCRLITEAHLGREDRRDPRLEFASLEARHAGLIVLSGCRSGLLPVVLQRDGRAAARRLAERCRAVFGREHFFVELQRNYVRGDLALTGALHALADDAQLGVVASGNVHYHARPRHRLHDVLVAIRHRTTLDGSHDVRHANSEFFLRPPQEVEALFRDCPDAVANSLALAERCRGFDLTRDLGYRFPDFHGAGRAPAPRALAELCRARLEERYPAGSVHRVEAERRLAEELRLVEHHRLSGFFLVYHDLFDLAREVAADARLGRFLRRVLPARPLTHRPGRHPALHRAVPERDPRLGAGHRPRFPARDPRRADPAGVQALRRRARRARLLVPHLPPALDGARDRQGAGSAAGRDRASREAGGPAIRRAGGRIGPVTRIRGAQERAALERAVRARRGDRGVAAPRIAARRRDDHLEPAARGDRAARARRHGRPRRVPVGQGFLRRRPLHQDRLPGARHAVARGRVRRADRRARRAATRPLAYRLRGPRGIRPHLPR